MLASISAIFFSAMLAASQAAEVDLDLPDDFTLVEKPDTFDIGGWKLRPGAAIGGGSNSNITKTTDPVADRVAIMIGKLNARGTIAGIKTRFDLTVSDMAPERVTRKNELYVKFKWSSRYAVTDHLELEAKSSVETTAKGLSTDRRDVLTVIRGSTGATWEVGDITVSAAPEIEAHTYPRDAGLADTRAYSLLRGTATIDRRLAPDTHAYVVAKIENVTYDRVYDDYGLKRGSTGVVGVVGLRGPLSPTVSAEAAVGLRYEHFGDRSFHDVLLPTLDASLRWSPDKKTRYSAGFETTYMEGVDGTADYGAAGLTTYKASLRAERFLDEKTLIALGVYAAVSDYLQAHVREKEFGGEVSVERRIEKNLRVALTFDAKKVISNETDSSYDRQRVMLRLIYN